jgi:Bacterial PH domain
MARNHKVHAASSSPVKLVQAGMSYRISGEGTMGYAELIRNTEEQLEPEEKVLGSILGWRKKDDTIYTYGSNRTLVVAADRRLLISENRTILGDRTTEIPYASITRLEQSRGITGSKLKISISKGKERLGPPDRITASINKVEPDNKIVIGAIKEKADLDLLKRKINNHRHARQAKFAELLFSAI